MLGPEFGRLEIFPNDPNERDSTKEVILLLHGLGGNKFDWIWPEWRRYNYDLSSPPPHKKSNKWIPPVIPLAVPSGASLSKRKPVGCWWQFLISLGHTVIVYSQDGPKDKTEKAYLQLKDRIVPYIQNEVLIAGLAGKKVTVLAHSRGGVLIRLYLTRAASDEAESWLGNVITLHSPHTGSRLAGLEDSPLLTLGLPGVAQWLLLPATTLIRRFLFRVIFDWFMDEGARELAPEDPLFNELDATTNPAPAVSFRTFRGASVTLTNLYIFFFHPLSYVPVPTLAPPFWKFKWDQVPFQIGSIADSLAPVTSPLVRELSPGLGDLLVAVDRADLDFADNKPPRPLNHAEPLTDEDLFREVASLLGTPTDAGDVSPCAPGFIGNLRTRQLHDLRNENTNCQIDEIVAMEVFETIEAAKEEGYDGCYYCLRSEHAST